MVILHRPQIRHNGYRPLRVPGPLIPGIIRGVHGLNRFPSFYFRGSPQRHYLPRVVRHVQPYYRYYPLTIQEYPYRVLYYQKTPDVQSVKSFVPETSLQDTSRRDYLPNKLHYPECKYKEEEVEWKSTVENQSRKNPQRPQNSTGKGTEEEGKNQNQENEKCFSDNGSVDVVGVWEHKEGKTPKVLKTKAIAERRLLSDQKSDGDSLSGIESVSSAENLSYLSVASVFNDNVVVEMKNEFAVIYAKDETNTFKRAYRQRFGETSQRKDHKMNLHYESPDTDEGTDLSSTSSNKLNNGSSESADLGTSSSKSEERILQRSRSRTRWSYDTSRSPDRFRRKLHSRERKRSTSSGTRHRSSRRSSSRSERRISGSSNEISSRSRQMTRNSNKSPRSLRRRRRSRSLMRRLGTPRRKRSRSNDRSYDRKFKKSESRDRNASYSYDRRASTSNERLRRRSDSYDRRASTGNERLRRRSDSYDRRASTGNEKLYQRSESFDRRPSAGNERLYQRSDNYDRRASLGCERPYQRCEHFDRRASTSNERLYEQSESFDGNASSSNERPFQRPESFARTNIKLEILDGEQSSTSGERQANTALERERENRSNNAVNENAGAPDMKLPSCFNHTPPCIHHAIPDTREAGQGIRAGGCQTVHLAVYYPVTDRGVCCRAPSSCPRAVVPRGAPHTHYETHVVPYGVSHIPRSVSSHTLPPPPSLTPTRAISPTPSHTPAPTVSLIPSHTPAPTVSLIPSHTPAPTVSLIPSHTPAHQAPRGYPEPSQNASYLVPAPSDILKAVKSITNKTMDNLDTERKNKEESTSQLSAEEQLRLKMEEQEALRIEYEMLIEFRRQLDIIESMDLIPEAFTEGASTSRAITAGESTARAITARAITAGESTARAITAGESTARAITAGESTARAITARAITAGESTARVITARAITAGESTARAITARAITAGESTARAITAGESTAREITAGESTARESTSRESAAEEGTAREVPEWKTTGVYVEVRREKPSRQEKIYHDGDGRDLPRFPYLPDSCLPQINKYRNPLPTVGNDNEELIPGPHGLPVRLTQEEKLVPYDLDGRRIPIGPDNEYIPVDMAGRVFPHVWKGNVALPVYMCEKRIMRTPDKKPLHVSVPGKLPVSIEGKYIRLDHQSRPFGRCPNIPRSAPLTINEKTGIPSPVGELEVLAGRGFFEQLQREREAGRTRRVRNRRVAELASRQPRNSDTEERSSIFSRSTDNDSSSGSNPKPGGSGQKFVRLPPKGSVFQEIMDSNVDNLFSGS